MLAWVIRTRKAGADALQRTPAVLRTPGQSRRPGAGFQLGSHNLQVNFFEGKRRKKLR